MFQLWPLYVRECVVLQCHVCAIVLVGSTLFWVFNRAISALLSLLACVCIARLAPVRLRVSVAH